MDNKPSRLINEKSPYLLQHAYNPVDWFPWSDEAFKKAREDNKPVFLSIGYSTCHWCHVMEKESFEDPEVARLMNEAFVSIKVDREERPDLDNIYMSVCQMLTGSGGWPLTIIMTPDKKPFFAGTYIPKHSRFGRTGIMQLIPRVREIWNSRRNEVMESAEKIIGALKGMDDLSPGQDLDSIVLDKAYDELASRFDEEHGGFGSAPKFPTPHNLFFLLRYWKRTEERKALQMVEKTLTQMRRGGIYDHIGFGFHRYSTDREWLVPHFEKMLYDQALLSMAYIETYQATAKGQYAETAKEIFEYILRDMTSPEGGFYSAEDADSERAEGKFYVWEYQEIMTVLGKDKGDLIACVFNIDEKGNFNDEASGEKTGANILHIKESIPNLAAAYKMPANDLEEMILSGRAKLFENREKRAHPQKDDKILTDWNGLMIAALAKGSQVLEKKEYLDAAEKAAGFILNSMRGPDGRILHRYRDGTAGIAGHLDDYAFLIMGLIEIYEACFDTYYLKSAVTLNSDMISHFWDKKNSGLFFTPDDGESLIVRKKEIHDGAIPSGNSVAMSNMLRLARLTGRPELEERAFKTGRAFSNAVKRMPSAHTYLMTSVDFGIGPSYEVVIAGNSKGNDTKKMIRALSLEFNPNIVAILRPTEKEATEIDELAEFVKYHVSVDNRATAYVCMDNSCKTPTTEIAEMLKLTNK